MLEPYDLMANKPHFPNDKLEKVPIGLLTHSKGLSKSTLKRRSQEHKHIITEDPSILNQKFIDENQRARRDE